MLPISARDVIDFTPPGLDGQPDAPVYRIAVPTILSRAAFRRELQAEGAVWHDDAALGRALRDALPALFDEEQAQALSATLDRFEAERARLEDAAKDKAAMMTAGEPVAEPTEEEAKAVQAFRALADQVAELEAAARQAHPPFARILAERAHYLSLAPLLAARMFLAGWKNVATPFKRLSGRATDDCLMRIPEDHLTMIGWKVMSLFRPSEAQAKN